VPKRSTPFQAVVRLVREHLAQPGVTVTESLLLTDSVLGVEREVDIVIEGTLDGEPIVISMEVNQRARPATLPWVQEQIAKHRNLPTNRLILVSKAGFTATALREVALAGGKVEALTPEVVMSDGEPVVTRLLFAAINYAPRVRKVHVRYQGELHEANGAEIDVFAHDGTLLGSLGHLTHEVLTIESVQAGMLIRAHNHPEREALQVFRCGFPVGDLGYYAKRMETGELHPIEEVEIWGEISFSQAEIPLTLTRLGGRLFGAAEAVNAFGRQMVWVGTTDYDAQVTTISWQATDRADLDWIPVPHHARLFPGLLKFSVPLGSSTGLLSGVGIPRQTGR
jgi:hypothetical protein